MKAWGVLLLATILAHALLPIAPPTVKTSGSPFSASTLDVSTAPSRKAVAADERRTREPDAPTRPAVHFPSMAVFAPTPAPARRLARGPPAASPLPEAAYPAGSALPGAPPLS